MSLGRRERDRGGRRRRSMRLWLAIVLLGVAGYGARLLWEGNLPLQVSGWAARPQGEVCRVDRVLDGDSLRVLCATGPVEVRLHCIDAPERDQVPWAKRSLSHLRESAAKEVELVTLAKDRFGRFVAEVYGTGPGSPLLNLDQVISGHAAVYRRYCDDPRYERAERTARDAGRGIWSLPGDQQAPWRFRERGHR